MLWSITYIHNNNPAFIRFNIAENYQPYYNYNYLTYYNYIVQCVTIVMPINNKSNMWTGPGATVQYSLSCQGNIQLILNRYIYCMRHTRKNNERMWRCVNYTPTGCNATTVTKDDMVIFRWVCFIMLHFYVKTRKKHLTLDSRVKLLLKYSRTRLIRFLA